MFHVWGINGTIGIMEKKDWCKNNEVDISRC